MVVPATEYRSTGHTTYQLFWRKHRAQKQLTGSLEAVSLKVSTLMSPALDDRTWVVGLSLWSSNRKFKTANRELMACKLFVIGKLTHEHDRRDLWISDPVLLATI
jgi:hypothetical protein